MSVDEQRATGNKLAEVSNAIVRIFRDCYGRGPTKAKTYMFDDYVVTVLEDLLTTVETTLVKNGEHELVRKVRLTFQEAEAHQFIGAVEGILGREVQTYHSQIAFDPPMGFEMFVLKPAGGG